MLGIPSGVTEEILRPRGGLSSKNQTKYLKGACADFAGWGTRTPTEEELLAWLRQLLRHNHADFTRR